MPLDILPPLAKELFLDFETFGPRPIRDGVFAYGESVEIMVVTYAFGNGPVQIWDRTAEPMAPPDLIAAAGDPDIAFIIHQAMFDMTMNKFDPVMPLIPWNRVICSMAMALAHGLPGGLDKLCAIFGIAEDKAKMKEGKALIRRFCIPQNKKSKIRRHTRETDPEGWAVFLKYAARDIEAQRAVYRKLPKWNYPALPSENHLYQLDQRINARGIAVDLELAHAAIESADRLKHDMSEQVKDITFGLVGAATQRDALLAHLLRGYGFALPDLRTSTVEVILDDKGIDLPDPVRELLEIRVNASRNSTAKYKALLRSVSSDGRLRGTLQFCGASRTSRWSSKLMQLQNLARVPKYLKKQYDYAISTVKNGSIDLIFDKPMEVLGAVVRGSLIAKPGHKLVISDLSNIEGRGIAWAAGEKWKIKAFEEFDKGIGEDIYKLAYARMFGMRAADVDDGDERQVGKTFELSSSYGGSVGAAVTFALIYGVDLEELARKSRGSIPASIWERSGKSWEWAENNDGTCGLQEHVYRACWSLSRMWRAAHPEVVAWWGELDTAAKQATLHPGVEYPARCVTFLRTKNWLRMIMPNGSCLCYPAPKIIQSTRKIRQQDGEESEIVDQVMTYMGTNPFTKQWGRIRSYGPKFAENAVQKLARDVLAENMSLISGELWNIVLHVHDEVVTEVPDDDDWTVDQLSTLLATQPKWAKGLPLAAAGFSCKAYRKE